MATHARQQYFADENSLSKERREFSIADEIQEKIDSVEEGAQVNRIETVKVNGTALTPDANKAVNVEVPDVIDNLYTVAADDALSAKQGKILYDYIQNLQTIGRFLSNWDSATGLPITNPSESPYLYKAGDYYRVSNVAASPATNYKPDGSSYTIGAASTTVETLAVAVSDLYLYDGTDWILLSNSGSSIAVDSSLSTISTNPVENRVITNALNGKHPGAISNVAPSSPVEGMLWYDTTNDELKVYDGSNWTGVGGGDVLVSTQANNIFTPGMKIRGGTESDYQSLTPDSNTAYLLLAGGPTPPSPWQPGVNTLAYYPLTSVSTTSDLSGNNYTLSNDGNTQFGTYAGVDCAYINFTGRTALSNSTLGGQIGLNTPFTYSAWVNSMYVNSERGILSCCYTGGRREDRAITVMGDAKIRFYINGGGANFAYTPSISANTWYYVVGTFDGTNMKVYLNAVLSETTASGYSEEPSATTFAIGTKHPSQSDAFEGYVSNVIVEDKAWTSQEIQDYFDQTKANYGIS